MHIVLMVLKIAGIVLLILLAVVLALLLLLVFAPICYRAEGSYRDDKLHVMARIRFLYPVFGAKMTFSEGKLSVVAKAFFFPIYRLPDSKTRKHKADEEHVSEEDSAPGEEHAPGDEHIPEEDSAPGDEHVPEADLAQKGEAEKAEHADFAEEADGKHAAGEEHMPEKIHYFIKTLKTRIQGFVQMIRSLRRKGEDAGAKLKKLKQSVRAKCAKAERYYEIWQMDMTQRAFGKAKKKIVRLLKSVKPRKGKLHIHFGMGDPASTGQICAFFGMIYPFVGNYVMIEPEMEQKMFEGDFFFRGHLSVCMLLRAAWWILFDKDIKKLIAVIKKADKEAFDE